MLFFNQLGFIYALHFTTASTVALVFGTLPIFTVLIATLSGVERATRALLARRRRLVRGRRARRRRRQRHVLREPEGRRARAARGGHLGRLLGHDRADDGALLAVPDQRVRARRMAAILLAIAGSQQLAEENYPSCVAGVGRVRVRRRRAARRDERALVHGDRPRRPFARRALREPPVLPRGDLRRDPAVGDAHAAAGRRRRRDRSRDPAQPLPARPPRRSRSNETSASASPASRRATS